MGYSLDPLSDIQRKYRVKIGISNSNVNAKVIATVAQANEELKD